ncbi:MAG: MurR/RpiR family transcriptional regulator [Butyrivibrio sp.]|nr:MurR/RpiR family transcriptional regulator [Butyrivibrio sp.]
MTILEERIKSVYTSLTREERKAADYCLKNDASIFNKTVAQLATDSGTTQATWSRFAKSLGYTGLKGLKHELFTSANNAEKPGPKIEFKDVDQYTSMQAIADNICATSTQAIQTTYRLFESKSFEGAVDAIINARMIRIFGVGSSGLAAYDLYTKLQRLSYNVTFNEDFHNSLMNAAQLREDDVAVFLCDSGKTEEIMQLLKIAKEKGSATVAITKLGNSPLAQGCDHVMFTTSPEIDKKSGVTSSRFAQLFMVDTLYTAIANKDFVNIRQHLQDSYNLFHDMANY